MKVAVFVGGRADLGPLAPVLVRLADDASLDLVVLTAVGFDAPAARDALVSSGVPPVDVVRVGPLLSGDSPRDAAGCGAQVSEGVADVVTDVDVLVVLGDRWELPWVTMPAVLARVPIVHLHGGEVTEGAIDERVRHAVSKLADVHCVASVEGRDRLVQMGEAVESVHVTGAPGLDRLTGARPFSDAEASALLGCEVHRPIALFTYHAVTTEPVERVAENAVAALRGTSNVVGTVVLTHPGPDPGGRQVRDALLDEAARLDDVVVVPSLGADYPRLLATCDVVVGNSSSGVIEAATAGVPAVDVGTRQAGRLRASSVVHATDGEDTVRDAVRSATASPRPERVDNPYGDGHAARRIVEVIREASGRSGAKRFVDLERRSAGDRRDDVT